MARLGKSGQRLCRPSAGGRKSSGRRNSRSTSGNATERALSTVSEMALKPTQAPEKRDRAQPYRPNSRYSPTSAGLSTGMLQAIRACSLWCGMEELTQPWSSPHTTSTPPWGEEP